MLASLNNVYPDVKGTCPREIQIKYHGENILWRINVDQQKKTPAPVILDPCASRESCGYHGMNNKEKGSSQGCRMNAPTDLMRLQG